METGDSWLNGVFTRLPGGARFEIEMQWGSIGWACPARFGYAMGLEPDRRLVSVIGDGSFQLTAQEVANMIRYGQETTIFLVNNRGYVVESAIHDGPYNYIKNWDYAGLIDAWNADDGHGLGLKATTGKELAEAISQSPQAQGRPGADRMPDRARRLQHPAARMGLKGRPRQRPPAPDHLIHTVVRTHSQAVHRPANVENSRRTQMIKARPPQPAARPMTCYNPCSPDRI